MEQITAMLSGVSPLMRRIRIRSWKDVVVYVVGFAAYVGLLYFLKKLFPAMSEKTVNVISFIIVLILIVVLLFAVGD